MKKKSVRRILQNVEHEILRENTERDNYEARIIDIITFWINQLEKYEN